MKKLFLTSVVIALIASLAVVSAGCDKNKDESDQSSNAKEIAAETTEAEETTSAEDPYAETPITPVTVKDFETNADELTVWVASSGRPYEKDGTDIEDADTKLKVYSLMMSVLEQGKTVDIPTEYIAKGGFYRRVEINGEGKRYRVFIDNISNTQMNFGVSENSDVVKSYHIDPELLTEFCDLCGIEQPIDNVDCT